MDFTQNLQYKDALLKYANSYINKKRKLKGEVDFEAIPRRYVIYARKSTEDDKRQVQSIEDQVEQCQKCAKANNLEIVDILREERSAKVAGRRNVFNSMLEGLVKGDSYNSILSWHPDRLSRNMKESGEILDMLDNDLIIDLKFPSYSFNNDAAGKMTLSILFAMAKEFSDKLSEDTKRGNRKKVKEGKYMGSDKRGYIKGKDEYFRPHPDTYEFYKSAWVKYMQVNNQSEVAKWLQEQGENVTINKISEFFKDPFSAGIYTYSDQVIDLVSVDPKFKPLVSAKDFVMMQKMNRDNPRGWRITKEFRPFNKLIVCEDCGHYMTSGLSKGKDGTLYLGVTCGNKLCKAKRIENRKMPKCNTIRGEEIINFAKTAIIQLQDVSEDVYKKAKVKYFDDKNSVIHSINEEVRTLKIKKTKIEHKEKKATEILYKEKEGPIKEKIISDIKIFLRQITDIDQTLSNFEDKKGEL